MKILLPFLMLLALSLPSVALSQTVTTVLGANVACDPTVDTCLYFPTSPSILCNGSGGNLDCPQFFHPDWSQPAGARFFGISNRTNPPRYLVSTDGATWSLVPTQPFVAAVLNFGGSVAVGADGSLLAISGQGANLCIIRKSTDQGANWTTQFTNAVQNCSIGFGSPTPPGAYCAVSGGYCAFVNPFNAATMTVLYSSDNGSNWTIGTAYAHPTADSRTWGPILGADGGAGIIVRGVNSSIGEPFGTKTGGDFTATVNYVPVPATNRNCRPYILNNAARALCTPNAGGNSFQVVNGTIPVEIGSAFTLTDVQTVAVNEPLVVGFQNSFGYLVIPSASITTRLNLYLSTNQFAGGAALAGTFTTSTAVIAGCCKGNFMGWGGKLYFTSGASGAQAFFGRIQ